ncbi:MAG: lipopolysaccharide biosynthesis protein [Bacteroidota bacterium]
MNSENDRRKPLSEEISLKDVFLKLKVWFKFLFSKWIVILFCGLLGGAGGLAYSLYRMPLYTASTTFVLEDDKGNSGGLGSLAGLASMAGVDLGSGGGGIFQGDNILQLYKSRSMIQKTLLTVVTNQGKKELLVDRYIAFNKLREGWADKPLLEKISFVDSKPRLESKGFTRLQDSVLGSITAEINKSNLKVTKPDKKLSIIKVEVVAEDEFFAKAFNEQIVKNVNDFYVQTKTKKSMENVAILQQKVDSVRTIMSGAIYSAARISDATPNLNPTRQVQRTAPMQSSQFNAEMNKVILAELVKNLELSKISLRKEIPLIQVVDEPVFPLDKDRIGKAKGMIIGGILMGILSVIALIISKLLKGALD